MSESGHASFFRQLQPHMFTEGTGEQTGFAHTTQPVECHQTDSPLATDRQDQVEGSETQMRQDPTLTLTGFMRQADVSESVKCATLGQYTTHVDLIDAQG
jgi:hypothetical protein